jgi:hypothetical protein
MKSLRLFATAAAATVFATALAFAGDPTGTWKWTIPGRDGQPRDVTLKLELKDGQLSGTMGGFRGDTPINAGSFKDDQLAFSVVREFNGSKFEQKYQGKLDGDTITGFVDFTGRDGQPMHRDWTATRQK